MSKSGYRRNSYRTMIIRWELVLARWPFSHSFRQMALGNVMVSIVAGSKVYLSEKNISYTWLKNLGFKIFSVEKDLKNDIENGKISLSEKERQINNIAYNELTNKKNAEDFLKLLPKLIS